MATAVLVLAATLQSSVLAHAQHAAAPPDRRPVERHHYVMNARVRPLLFWISRADVGDAVVARARTPDSAAYALLIGSDPDKAPRRINRWGYIEEVVESGRARIRGLMTQSDEESVREAEASVRNQKGHRIFRSIQGTVSDGEARSVVTSVTTREDYSLRSAKEILGLAKPDGQSTERVLRIDAATRPGFVVALADLMHQQASAWRTSRQLPRSEPVRYVYHGKLYRLAVRGARALPAMRVGSVTYENVITSQFRIENLQDGAVTEFSMSYAADGDLAELPVAVTYRPRWWFEVRLALDDRTPGPPLATGFDR